MPAHAPNSNESGRGPLPHQPVGRPAYARAGRVAPRPQAGAAHRGGRGEVVPGGRKLLRLRPPSIVARRANIADRKRGAAPATGLWFFNWKLWLGAKQFLAEALGPLELAPREFWMLAIIHDGPVPQHELAALCGLDPSTLVPLLDALERRGWVVRRRDPRDRRVQRISLAAAGAARFRQALPLARRAEARQMQALAPAERRRLFQLLRKLLDA